MKNLSRAVAAVLSACAIVVLSGCALLPGQAAIAVPAETSGKHGAVDFDAGTLTLGSGPTKVDVWFDLQCPYCAQFEHTNGETIADGVADGSLTLRLHPIAFLDSAVNEKYSTRAAVALTCVGLGGGEPVLRYYRDLFAAQPVEGEPGLTDGELAARAKRAGASDIASCQRKGKALTAWVGATTQAALDEPIRIDGRQAADRLVGTPTVFVDGKKFSGSLKDAAAFEARLHD